MKKFDEWIIEFIEKRSPYESDPCWKKKWIGITEEEFIDVHVIKHPGKEPNMAIKEWIKYKTPYERDQKLKQLLNG